MKNISVLLLFLCGVTQPLFADDQIKFPYALVLVCELSTPCMNNSVCQIEVSISINDFFDKKRPAKGLASWTQGPTTTREGNEDWAYDDKITMDALVDLTDSNIVVKTLGDYPPPTTLSVSNISVGKKSTGSLQRGSSKFQTYTCARYKDPK